MLLVLLRVLVVETGSQGAQAGFELPVWLRLALNSSTSCVHPPPGAGISGVSHHAAMPGTQLFVCHLIGALCPFSELGVGV